MKNVICLNHLKENLGEMERPIVEEMTTEKFPMNFYKISIFRFRKPNESQYNM